MYGDTAAGRKRVAQLREQGGDVRALAARLVSAPTLGGALADAAVQSSLDLTGPGA